LTLLLLVVANLAALPVLAKAQSPPDSGDSSGAVARTTPAQPGLPYARPAQTTKLRNYFFDAFGPYPIVGAALTAGIDSGPTSESQRQPPRCAMRCQKPSMKTRCTTAVSGQACFRA
jgi:hypothetical protein